MRYLLTNNANVIMEIGDSVEEQEDRYIINQIVIFKEYRTQNIEGNIVIDNISLYEVEEVPEGVTSQKYCYTGEQGFYKNTDYREHYSEEDRIAALEDMVNMILLGEE